MKLNDIKVVRGLVNKREFRAYRYMETKGGIWDGELHDRFIADIHRNANEELEFLFRDFERIKFSEIEQIELLINRLEEIVNPIEPKDFVAISN